MKLDTLDNIYQIALYGNVCEVRVIIQVIVHCKFI